MPISSTVTTDLTNPDQGLVTVAFDLSTINRRLWTTCSYAVVYGAVHGSFRDPTRFATRYVNFAYGSKVLVADSSVGISYQAPYDQPLPTPKSFTACRLYRSLASVRIQANAYIWPYDTYTFTINYTAITPFSPRQYFAFDSATASYLAPRFSQSVLGLLTHGYNNPTINSANNPEFIRQVPTNCAFIDPEWMQPQQLDAKAEDQSFNSGLKGAAGSYDRIVHFLNSGQHFVNGVLKWQTEQHATRSATNSLSPLFYGLPAAGEVGLFLSFTFTSTTTATVVITFYNTDGATISTASLGPYPVVSLGASKYGLAMTLDFSAVSIPSTARYYQLTCATANIVTLKVGSFKRDLLLPKELGHYPSPIPTMNFEDVTQWQPGCLISS